MSTVPANPMPESLVEGRYRLLDVIGEGGMATVYRAFDLRLQRPRAVKVLSPSLALRPSLRKRFLAEAQTMANLEESRVVRIFDTGEDGDRVYIVMELIEGGSLLDRVRDFGPLPPRMAADATIQICESLQAAHDAGVIHRDIKPHNILLTRTGEIRVTDFGIAQVQTENDDGLTRTGAVMGTWGFMAPEQKTNAKQVDVRADVYSVGATLWSLLRGETPPELFMAETEPGMLADVPEELAEVIKRATRYRREDRYLSARAMAESLRALVSMLPEDPEITVPLVGHTLERPGKPMDTMQQFASEVITGEHDALGTMVPDVGELSDAADAGSPSPATDEPAAAPRVDARPVAPRPPPEGPPRPALAGDTFSSEAPRSAIPWVLATGAMLVALALTVAGVGYLIFTTPDAETAPITPPLTDLTTEPKPAAVVTPVQPVAPVAPDQVVPGLAVQGADPVLPVPPGGAPVNGTNPDAQRPADGKPKQGTPQGVAPLNGTAVTPPEAVTPTVTEPAPTRKPSLSHATPGGAKVGDVIPFAVTLPDAGWTVKLYYRPAAGGAFDEKPMKGTGGTYATSVKATDAMAGGVAYFISAAKGDATLKEGSYAAPKTVAVTP
ncbi:MAG: protein kinase [Pseudomonadota bacterium]|nr:protein kinase [Pseudomonadota bacterium]